MTSANNLDDLIRQVRSARVYLILTAVLALGVIFLLISQGTERKWFTLSEPWQAFPWLALGEAFVSAFLIGLIYEGVVRRQSEALMGKLFVESLTQERETVIDRLTLDSVTSAEAVKRLNSEELNEAIVKVLSARFRDERLARGIATTLFPQALPNVELTRDFEMRVQLLPDQDLPDQPSRYFTARICARYHRQLHRAEFTFGVSDDSVSVTSRIGVPGPLDVVWNTNKMVRYAYNDPRTFHVEYVRIDENELDITTSDVDLANPKGGQPLKTRVYTATSDALAELVGKDVEINYCIITKVPRLGHLLYLPLTQTCEGVIYEFDIEDIGIARATLVPFFLSAARPQVREDRFGNRRMLSARTTSWVLQGGGIVLSWKLREELDPSYVAHVYGTGGEPAPETGNGQALEALSEPVPEAQS